MGESMATLNDIFDLVKTLSDNDREKLKDMISNTITKHNNIVHYVTEKRFASGAFCPHCELPTTKSRELPVSLRNFPLRRRNPRLPRDVGVVTLAYK